MRVTGLPCHPGPWHQIPPAPADMVWLLGLPSLTVLCPVQVGIPSPCADVPHLYCHHEVSKTLAMLCEAVERRVEVGGGTQSQSPPPHTQWLLGVSIIFIRNHKNDPLTHIWWQNQHFHISLKNSLEPAFLFRIWQSCFWLLLGCKRNPSCYVSMLGLGWWDES